MLAKYIIRNVAWKNPDGSKALIAYNTTGGSGYILGDAGSGGPAAAPEATGAGGRPQAP